MTKDQRSSMLHGVLLIALFSCAAFYIGEINFIKKLSISPMIAGIILGMIYANSLRNNLPETWVPGIKFCSKNLLRLGIILYGFKLTFQNIMEVGVNAIIADCIVVGITICGGILIGRLIKMDRDTALLTSVGSGICGAAAILGAESALKTQPYKTAVAVSTVVIFGTLSMFLYPILYRNGLLNLSPQQMGIMTGSTIHEVAHTVGAGNAMGREISDIAVIVKMIRVMLLVPVLLIIGFATAYGLKGAENGHVSKAGFIKTIPWFAIGFLAVIGFNSLNLIPEQGIKLINNIDTFLLTMAMCALGAETSIEKFKKAGAKPFLLASLLYIWLMGGGYCIAKLM
jgi:uncharacterized integral membrane protein (TIGR00698 family)